MATYGQVLSANQSQTTQGTAIDVACWAAVYRERFEREWRGSLATKIILLVSTSLFLSEISLS